MIVCIDIGNTDAVLGFFNGEVLEAKLRVPSGMDDFAAVLSLKISDFMLEKRLPFPRQVVLSSVVPDLVSEVEEVVFKSFGVKPFLIHVDALPEISIGIENKLELGQDLYANAAYAFYKHQKCCTIVDFGTALTFTTISERGEIIGVAIVPGLKTAVKALFSQTAQLPEVPLQMPNSVIGKNSVSAIQAGILIGYEGLVRHILAKIKEEIGSNHIAIATGGLSSIITPLKDQFEEINVDLTLQGLYQIAIRV